MLGVVVGLLRRVSVLGLMAAAMLALPSAASASLSWSTPVQIDSGQAGSGISCPTSDLCVAADSAGVVTSTTPSGTTSHWHPAAIGGQTAVACPSPNECVAGGGGVSAIAWSTDPTGGVSAWSTGSVDGLGNVLAMSCPSDSLCFASDDAGDIAYSDRPTAGSGAWSLESGVDGSNAINGLSCPTATLCVATDANGHAFVSTDPTKSTAWHDEGSVLGGGAGDGVSCTATPTCVVVGDGALASSTNPTGGAAAWHTVTPNNGGAQNKAVSCPSDTECVAVDDAGDALETTSPTGGAAAWTVTGIASDDLRAVSCPTSYQCEALQGSENVLTGVGQFTLGVTETGTGSGTVASSPTGITCPGTCSSSFPAGKQVTLSAHAASGSTFAGWSGVPGCSVSVTCAVTLTGNTTITATFTKNTTPPPGQHSLTVVLAGLGQGMVTGGGISCPPSCSGTYTSGTTITVTAAAAAPTSGFDPGSMFTGWSGGGCSGTGTCTVTLTANVTVTATFKPNPVSVSVTGVSPSSGSEDGGTAVTVTGTGFEPGATVEFGHFHATDVVVQSLTRLTAVSPPGRNTADVRVKDSAGTSPVSPADQFAYVQTDLPGVYLLAPAIGNEQGGYRIYVYGQHLDRALSVSFGATTLPCSHAKGAACRLVSGNALSVKVSPGQGRATVMVRNVVGTSPQNGYDLFTYEPRPVVGLVQGNPIPSNEGGPVTVQASGIAGLSAVYLGGRKVKSYAVSGNTIAFVAPKGTGTPDVTVKAAGGTSLATPADRVIYYTYPVVTGVGPNSGPEPGGYGITVEGHNFQRGMSVNIASHVRYLDSHEVAITVAAGSGTVPVTASDGGGTGPSGATFTYIPPPACNASGQHGPFTTCSIATYGASNSYAYASDGTEDGTASGIDNESQPLLPVGGAIHSNVGAITSSAGGGGVTAGNGDLQVAGAASAYPNDDYDYAGAGNVVNVGSIADWQPRPEANKLKKVALVFDPHALQASGNAGDGFDVFVFRTSTPNADCMAEMNTQFPPCQRLMDITGWAGVGYASIATYDYTRLNAYGYPAYKQYSGWHQMSIPVYLGLGDYPIFRIYASMGGAATADCSDGILACFGNFGASLDPVLVSQTPGITMAPRFTASGGLPVLGGASPQAARPGSRLTLSGISFGTGSGTVTFRGSDGSSHAMAASAWSDGTITVTVPSNLPLGQASVTMTAPGRAPSNAVSLWIGNGRPQPIVSAVRPSAARPGRRVTITGSHLSGVRGVLIGGRRARWRAHRGRLLAVVPRGAASGDVSVLTSAGPSAPSPESFLAILGGGSRRVPAMGGLLTLDHGVRLTFLPTTFHRRTRVTVSELVAAAIRGRLHRAARAAVSIVSVRFAHRPHQPVTLTLPGPGMTPAPASVWRIVGPGGRSLATSLASGTASASISRGGIYLLVRSR